MHVAAAAPPSLGNDVFTGIPSDAMLCVPCGSKEAYAAAAQWKNFSPIIQGSVLTTRSNNASMGAAAPAIMGVCPPNSQTNIEATPNPGYVFVGWSDGNTSNPRTVTVTRDTTFTAEFALCTFSVTALVAAGSEGKGSVTGGGDYVNNTQATLEANPNPGYIFVKWNDDNTSNPRTFTVTGRTTYTAEFAINSYTVNVNRNNDSWGTVSGNGDYEHGTQATLEATHEDHYHFVKWTDDDTNTPRTVTVTEHKTYTAIFALDSFSVTVEVATASAGRGTVTGGGDYPYGTQVTFNANADAANHYHFVRWSDGSRTNPRTVTVT
jgi:uncharacterized repeat protein (TIGR02543 family)